MKTIHKLWILIGILVVFVPIGLVIPEHFKAGAAWGEWGAGEIEKLVGYIPQGLAKLSSLWNAPMPDYAFKGWAGKPLSHVSFAYIISAAAGIAIVIVLMLAIGRLLSRKE